MSFRQQALHLYNRAAENDRVSNREHNGFANYSTWNTAFWIDREDVLFKAKCALLLELKQVTSADAERIATILLNGFTPDLGNELGQRWADINWDELAKHWEHERLELAIDGANQ